MTELLRALHERSHQLVDVLRVAGSTPQEREDEDPTGGRSDLRSDPLLECRVLSQLVQVRMTVLVLFREVVPDGLPSARIDRLRGWTGLQSCFTKRALDAIAVDRR